MKITAAIAWKPGAPLSEADPRGPRARAAPVEKARVEKARVGKAGMEKAGVENARAEIRARGIGHADDALLPLEKIDAGGAPMTRGQSIRCLVIR